MDGEKHIEWWVQAICPSPRRHVAHLIRQLGLRTGLDIGCGEVSILSPLRAAGLRTTALDVSLEAVQMSRRAHKHDAYVVGDLRQFGLRGQWDVVVLSHVIEHLPRDEATEVLRLVEGLARRLLYIETPFGFRPQPALDGNMHQRHLSGWLPNDFTVRGYSVFGCGLRGLRGVAGAARLLPESATRFVERASQWLVFRRPHLAGTIGAIRLLSSDGSPVWV